MRDLLIALALLALTGLAIFALRRRPLGGNTVLLRKLREAQAAHDAGAAADAIDQLTSLYTVWRRSTRLAAPGRDEALFVLAELANQLGTWLLEADRPSPAVEYFERAQATLRELPLNAKERRLLARTYVNECAARGRMNQDAEGLRAGLNAIELLRVLAAEQPGDRYPLATALMNTALGLFQLGRSAEAATAGAEAIVLLRELRGTDTLARALTNQAAILRTCRPAEALAAATEAIELRRAASAGPSMAIALNNLAAVQLVLEDREAALAAADEAASLLRDAHLDGKGLTNLVTVLGTRAEVLAHCGRYAEALADLADATRAANENAAPRYRGEAAWRQTIRAAALAGLGRPEEAREELSPALITLEELCLERSGRFGYERDKARALAARVA